MKTTKHSSIAARRGQIASFALLVAFLAVALCWQSVADAQTSAAVGPTQFKIDGAVTTPLTISQSDLKSGPRATLRAVNSHSNKTETYEGVPLAALLQKAGVPQGGKIQGPWMTAYVLVEAADNYQVVFSLAELDAGFLDSEVLVADTLDGAPLGAGEGPFKLVVPHDKRPARWVRMLKSITVVKPSNPEQTNRPQSQCARPGAPIGCV